MGDRLVTRRERARNRPGTHLRGRGGVWRRGRSLPLSDGPPSLLAAGGTHVRAAKPGMGRAGQSSPLSPPLGTDGLLARPIVVSRRRERLPLLCVEGRPEAISSTRTRLPRDPPTARSLQLHPWPCPQSPFPTAYRRSAPSLCKHPERQRNRVSRVGPGSQAATWRLAAYDWLLNASIPLAGRGQTLRFSLLSPALLPRPSSYHGWSIGLAVFIGSIGTIITAFGGAAVEIVGRTTESVTGHRETRPVRMVHTPVLPKKPKFCI